MAEHYVVKWSRVAESDLRSIIQYIQGTRPLTAKQVFVEIKTQAANLERYPELGRVVPELLVQGIGHYRELTIPPWRLIYRVSDTVVDVLAFIDSRRNVEDILLDRLIRPTS